MSLPYLKPLIASSPSLPLSLPLSLSLFFWLHLWHVEVPGPGIEPTPQQQPKLQQWQCWIPNLLSYKGAPFTVVSFNDAKQGFLEWFRVYKEFCCLILKPTFSERLLILFTAEQSRLIKVSQVVSGRIATKSFSFSFFFFFCLFVFLGPY